MREADMLGVGSGTGQWKAWVAKMERVRPAHQAALAEWLLFCPGAHAAWSYWWIGLIHLRPLEGVPPAHIRTSGAGWEMICMAQDPTVEPDPDRVHETLRMLTPIDWEVQFGDVKDDRQAEQVGVAVIRAIMSGTISPDSDFREHWERLIPGTAKHIAEGGHPVS